MRAGNLSRRERRFVQIAKDEATTDGFRSYAPVNGGPWLNGLLVVLIGLVVPFYLLYKAATRLIQAPPGS
jgi:hypothetical protein